MTELDALALAANAPGTIVVLLALLVMPRSAGTFKQRQMRISNLVAAASVVSHNCRRQPDLLIHNGHVIDAYLRQASVTDDEIMIALREPGLDALSETQKAGLEVAGTTRVIPCDVPVHHTRRRPRGRKRTS